MQALERTETRSHCAARRGDELRRQAETCRQLAASSLMDEQNQAARALSANRGLLGPPMPQTRDQILAQKPPRGMA
jgi:hypothetical protein